jgi:hypothetical protein
VSLIWSWFERNQVAISKPISGDNRRLGTDELVEFEKQLVEFGDFGRIIDHFRKIYRIYLNRQKAKPEDVNM